MEFFKIQKWNFLKFKNGIFLNSKIEILQKRKDVWRFPPPPPRNIPIEFDKNIGCRVTGVDGQTYRPTGTAISMSWFQKYVMTSKVRHDVKIRCDVKTFVMTSKIRHDVKSSS